MGGFARPGRPCESGDGPIVDRTRVATAERLLVGVPLAASVPDWLTAIGGVGAFVATAVLAFLATKQMKSLGQQTETLAKQTRAAQDQVTVMRRSSREQARAVRGQIDASVAQGRAIREAARAQLQPIVFAHPTAPWVRGPDDRLDLAEGQIGFTYYLANEGDGIALNIRHGVEIDGQDSEFGGGEFRVLRAGETVPILDPASGQLLQIRPLTVVMPEHELPPNWEVRPRRFWARFENIFSEPFETRNPIDPRESARFKRLPKSTPHRHPAYRSPKLP